ncbi:ecdysis triggering hormone receptor [Nesidiocoris tenuis]|uniref:Ecdysis triggering hormone receptor n=1 Tax=Nesidiocoris tenuis TaxID=355587 RepID=A0ABN7AZ85_9HEMI|nr:ecdysis triggering hormone receptor [Nesidiocoris tenuis]
MKPTLTSSKTPTLAVADYRDEEYIDGTIVKVCLMEVETFWTSFYFIMCIAIFFGIPLAILLVLYTVIACHLMSNPGLVAPNTSTSALRYRRQVVMMLGTVVVSFFVCLLPFRALTLCIIIAPPEYIISLGVEKFYCILYFSRIMFYLNSAVNPILYNLMSSKFREGFRKLLGLQEMDPLARKGTVTTTSLTTSSSRKSSSENHLLRRSVVRVISIEDSKSMKLLHGGEPNKEESYV